MPLVDVPLNLSSSAIPEEVEDFLAEANDRIERYFQRKTPGRFGFIPSNYEVVYRAMRALVDEDLANGSAFCEWGSGFGVIACLASMLEFDAWGIEIDANLVDAAWRLADDFGLPTEFVHGSFIPNVDDAPEDTARAAQATVTTAYGQSRNDQTPDWSECDVVFLFPWPNEEDSLESLFEKHAADEGLLLTFDSYDVIQLKRKQSE